MIERHEEGRSLVISAAPPEKKVQNKKCWISKRANLTAGGKGGQIYCEKLHAHALTLGSYQLEESEKGFHVDHVDLSSINNKMPSILSARIGKHTRHLHNSSFTSNGPNRSCVIKKRSALIILQIYSLALFHIHSFMFKHLLIHAKMKSMLWFLTATLEWTGPIFFPFICKRGPSMFV